MSPMRLPPETAAEQVQAQWRQRLLAGARTELEADPPGTEKTAVLDSFLQLVQARQLVLPPLLPTWPSLEAGGCRRLQRAQHVLLPMAGAEAQQQLELLAAQPDTIAQAQLRGFRNDAALPGCRRDSAALRAALAATLGLAQAKRLGMQLAASAAQRLPLDAYTRFFGQLEAARTGTARWRPGEAEQVALLKIAVLASTQPGHCGSLLALLEWSDRIGCQLGAQAWHALFQPRWVLSGGRIETLLHAAERTAELSQEMGLHAPLRALGKNQVDLRQYGKRLERLRVEQLSTSRLARDLGADGPRSRI